MAEQVEQLAASPLDSAAAVLALVEKVALDPGADAAKLERIIASYERLKAKEAELAFNAAKGRILKKLAGIKIAPTLKRPDGSDRAGDPATHRRC